MNEHCTVRLKFDLEQCPNLVLYCVIAYASVIDSEAEILTDIADPAHAKILIRKCRISCFRGSF